MVRRWPMTATALVFGNLSKMSKTSSRKLISPAQCRGARGMLGWSQDRLAEAAHVSRTLVAHFEGGNAIGHNNHAAISLALEEAGIEFIPENGGGDGLRFRERRSASPTDSAS